MKFYIFSFLSFLFIHPSICIANSDDIHGIIKSESGEIIPFAPVSILDSDTTSILHYTTSDENGFYSFDLKVNDELWIETKYLGYKSQKQKLSPNDKNIDFILEKSEIGLKEVTIKARMSGIRFNGDTIFYDPKTFIDGSEVMLGDLLNRMPGIEVDQQGNIKVQGKYVDKLLLNGQDFFSNNTQIATKNLSAEIVESIKVLKNYNELTQLKNFRSDEKTVIDIAIKKNKLGRPSGNIQLGGGIEEKYIAKGSLLQITPKTMISYIGASNNIGEKTLSFDDYMRLQGGINEVLGYTPTMGTIVLNLTQEESNMLKPENNTYSNTSNLSAINISSQPRSNIKLNSYLLFNGERKETEDNIKNTYINEIQNTLSQKEQNTEDQIDMFSGYLKLNYNPKNQLSLNYKGTFSILKSHKNSYINENIENSSFHVNEKRENKAYNISQNFSLIKNIGEHLLTTNVVLSSKNSPSTYNLQTDSLLFPSLLYPSDGWYYTHQKTKQNTFFLHIDAAFSYYINNSYFIKTGLSPQINNQIYQTSLHSETISPSNEISQNDYKIRTNHYLYYITFIKNKGLLRFKLGVSLNNYTFHHTLKQKIDDENIFKIQPETEITLHFSERHTLDLKYKQSYKPIQADAFITAPVITDYQSYITESNINRLISRENQVNLQYNYYDMFSNTMLYIMGGYSLQNNVATYKYIQEGTKTISYPTLSLSDSKYWFANAYINKGLGFIPWAVELNAEYEKNSSTNYPDNITNLLKNENFKGKVSINSRYRKRFNFDFFYDYQEIKNKSSLMAKQNQLIKTIGGKIKYNDKNKWKANIEIKYLTNRTNYFDKNYIDLNISARYMLNKRLELELSGMNILNLHKHNWIESTFNGFYQSERYFRQIPGNIILRINYRIN